MCEIQQFFESNKCSRLCSIKILLGKPKEVKQISEQYVAILTSTNRSDKCIEINSISVK